MSTSRLRIRPGASTRGRGDARKRAQIAEDKMLRPAEDKAGAGTVPDRRGFPSPAADPGPREARPGGGSGFNYESPAARFG